MGANAHAQNLLVDCSGQNQQAYHSINDALANLPFQQSNVIQVTPATCHETVYMSGIHNLMIAAPQGQSATIDGGGQGFATLFIDGGSTNIYLYGLNVTGGAPQGLYVNNGSQVTLDECSFQGNPGAGLVVTANSLVTVNSGNFSGNSQGISVGEESELSAYTPNGTVLISDNSGVGIFTSSGTFNTSGNTVVRHNGLQASSFLDGFGIDLRGAARLQFGNFTGPNSIDGNRNGGVSLQENTEASFWGGTNTIKNNGQTGVWARFGSQVTFFGNVEISGHSVIGIDIASSSQAYLNATLAINTVHDNGRASIGAGGIRLTGNSQLVLSGPNQIVQNGGPGVLSDINSSIDASNATISGNSGDGIKILHASVLNLGAGMTLLGNGGAAIGCDHTSLLVTQTSWHCTSVQGGVTEVSQEDTVVSPPVVPDVRLMQEEYDRWHKLIPKSPIRR